MTLMRVRRAAQLTLPADIRQALNVQEGDYLEAEIVQGGVLLKPVSVVQREKAWQGVVHAASKVRDKNPNPSEDNKAEEEAIAAEVIRMRHPRRKKHD